jgi:hypothetical protein
MWLSICTIQKELRDFRFEVFTAVTVYKIFKVEEFPLKNRNYPQDYVMSQPRKPLSKSYTICSCTLFQFHCLSCNVFSKLKFIKPKFP